MRLAVATIVATLALSLGAFANEQCGCTPQSLNGCYAVKDHGDIFKTIDPAGVIGPGKLQGIAELSFDGNGNFHGFDESVVNGYIISNFGDSKITGTYTISRNCTGALHMTFNDTRLPLDVQFVLGDNGKIIFGEATLVGGQQGVLEVQFEGRRTTD